MPAGSDGRELAFVSEGISPSEESSFLVCVPFCGMGRACGGSGVLSPTACSDSTLGAARVSPLSGAEDSPGVAEPGCSKEDLKGFSSA